MVQFTCGVRSVLNSKAACEKGSSSDFLSHFIVYASEDQQMENPNSNGKLAIRQVEILMVIANRYPC